MGNFGLFNKNKKKEEAAKAAAAATPNDTTQTDTENIQDAAPVEDTAQNQEMNSGAESNVDNTAEAAPEETPKPKEESTEAKTKAYIRVATYNKKTDADEALKKLDGDFKIRNSKTSSGKEVYIIISKTVSSNEDLEKLKEKVKNYSYQIINQK